MIDSSVLKAKQTMLDNWNQMKTSPMEDASEHADHFQNSFYEFMDQVVGWLKKSKGESEISLDDLLKLPMVEELLTDIPDPLRLNFELELEDFYNE